MLSWLIILLWLCPFMFVTPDADAQRRHRVRSDFRSDASGAPGPPLEAQAARKGNPDEQVSQYLHLGKHRPLVLVPANEILLLVFSKGNV